MPVSSGSPKITLTFRQALDPVLVQQLKLVSHHLQQVEGVQSVLTRLDPHCCQQLVIYIKDGIEQPALLRRMAVALRAAMNLPDPALASNAVAMSRVLINTTTGEEAAVRGKSIVQRLREFVYGSLAVASLGMAWVGLLTPGIPTVPFVILAVAFAAKASPTVQERLRNARVFGPMIRDWEAHRAVRQTVRTQAIVMTVVLVTITVLIAPPSSGLYLLVGTMSVISFVLIYQIPVIADEQHTNQSLGARPARLRVPAVA